MTPGTPGLPVAFWGCALLIGFLGIVFFKQRRKSWAVPALMVLGTIFTWYLGDILYSGIGGIAKLFPPEIIDRSLFQVTLFLATYAVLANEVARWFIRTVPADEPTGGSHDFDTPLAQYQVGATFWFASACWIVLFMIEMLRSGFPVVASLFPPLAGHRHVMWSRARLGGGMDFLLAAASYLQVFLCASFGVAFVLSRRLSVRMAAAVMIVLSWPYFFFGGVRGSMLAISTPAACGYALFSKHRLWAKITLLVVLFIAANTWFKFIIGTRNYGVTEVLLAIVKGEESADFVHDARHLGLDMFKELCHINQFIEDGRYEITWGKRYFAEVVNVVPRSLWPGKPTIGLDYSRARGATSRGLGSALVSVTVSTGVIGQGLVNFGRFFGPMAAAFLMALWTAILARLWTHRQSVMRTALFLLGLGLTFNAGRDLTLLVFFPFVFGYMMVLVWEHLQPRPV